MGRGRTAGTSPVMLLAPQTPFIQYLIFKQRGEAFVDRLERPAAALAPVRPWQRRAQAREGRRRSAPTRSCIDLEDAVADDEKVAARRSTSGRARRPTAARASVIVRVNGIDDRPRWRVTSPRWSCEGLDAIMVPKVEDTDDARATCDAAIAEAERAAGIAEGTVRVHRAHRDAARA